MVVSLYRTDRHGDKLLPSFGRQVSFRCGRGRRLSERGGGDRSMVPAFPQGHNVWSHIDGEPDWRSPRAAAGSAYPKPLWMAGVILRLWCCGNLLGDGLVRLVPRFAGSKKWSRAVKAARRCRTDRGVRTSISLAARTAIKEPG